MALAVSLECGRNFHGLPFIIGFLGVETGFIIESLPLLIVHAL
jgi:hypothetical protein